MSLNQFANLPLWIYRLAWSVIVLLAAYLLGRLVTRTICQRLSAWAAKTTWKWDDLVVSALRRGVPTWSLLVGLYVVVGLWPLPQAASRALQTGRHHDPRLARENGGVTRWRMSW